MRFPLTPAVCPQAPPFGRQWLLEHKFLGAQCYQSSNILTRQIWTWHTAGITWIPLLNVRGVSPSPFLSQGNGLSKDSCRFCGFLDSVNLGIKVIFLLLARQRKYSDNFHSDDCSEHNQSLSHMFSFGLQSLFFHAVLSPYQLPHLMYFIYRYLPFLILQELRP